MSRMALVLLGFCVVLSVALVMADEEPQYLGVAGCKTCHKSKKKGDQYGIWSNSAMRKATIPITGGIICPPLEATASTAPANSGL